MTGDDPGHASAVAQQLAEATDEELEAAGIDPDHVDDQDDEDDFEAITDVQIQSGSDVDVDIGPGDTEHTLAVIDEFGQVKRIVTINDDPDVVDVIDDRYTTTVRTGTDGVFGTLHLEEYQEFDAGILVDVQRLRELVDEYEVEFSGEERHAFLSFVEHSGGNEPTLVALRPRGYDRDAAVMVPPNGGDRQ